MSAEEREEEKQRAIKEALEAYYKIIENEKENKETSENNK